MQRQQEDVLLVGLRWDSEFDAPKSDELLSRLAVNSCIWCIACKKQRLPNMQSRIPAQAGMYLCFHLFCQKRIINHWGLIHLKNPYL